MYCNFAVKYDICNSAPGRHDDPLRVLRWLFISVSHDLCWVRTEPPSLSADIYQLLFNILPVIFTFAFIHSCSITPILLRFCLICLFDLFCLIIQWLTIHCHFSVLILELYSRYFDPHNNISTTIWQVNKHHTQDCAIFCLSIGSKRLL